MIKLFIYSILFFCTSIFASEIPVALRQVQSINKKEFGTPVTSGFCQQCDKPPGIEQCVVDLCGSPILLPTTYLNEDNYIEYVQPIGEKRYKEVEPLIKEALNGYVAEAKRFSDIFSEKVASNTKKINIDSWSPYEYDALAPTLFDGNYDLKIDTSKPIYQRLNINPLYPSDASSVFKKGIDSFINAKKKLLMGSLSEGVFEGLYTFDEAKKLGSNDFNNFVLTYKKRLKEKPDTLKDKRRVIEQYISSVDLSSLENTYDFGNIASRISYFKNLIVEEDTGDWPEQRYLCLADDCKRAVKEFVSGVDLGKMASDLKSLAHSKDYIPSFLTRCKIATASRGLIDYDRERFKTELPEVLDGLHKNVLSRFSSESQLKLKTFFVDELEFSGGKNNASEKIDNFLDYLKNSHQRFLWSKNNPQDYSYRSLAELIAIFFQDYEVDGAVKMRKYFASCLSGGAIMWDSFADKGILPEGTEKNVVNVSMYSNLHLAHGKAIIAHELGHALSFAFSDSKLSKSSVNEFNLLRKCSAEEYIAPISQVVSGYGRSEGKFIEEDTADLISFMIFKDQQVNLCSLLDVSNDKKSFINLSLEQSRLKNTHSTGIMRILRESINKKHELPVSCQSVLEAEKNNYRFKSCL